MRDFRSLIGAFALIGSLIAPLGASAQAAPVALKGAEVDGALQQALDSKSSHDGDRFTLAVRDTLFHRNAALSGGTIEGHVENVLPAARGQKASLNVVIDDIKMSNGSVAPLHAQITSMSEFQPKSHHLRNAGIIVGAAMVGHMVSKKTGHKGGTLAGVASGFAITSNLKNDIHLKRGTVVKLRLLDDVVSK